MGCPRPIVAEVTPTVTRPSHSITPASVRCFPAFPHLPQSSPASWQLECHVTVSGSDPESQVLNFCHSTLRLGDHPHPPRTISASCPTTWAALTHTVMKPRESEFTNDCTCERRMAPPASCWPPPHCPLPRAVATRALIATCQGPCLAPPALEPALPLLPWPCFSPLEAPLNSQC